MIEEKKNTSAHVGDTSNQGKLKTQCRWLRRLILSGALLLAVSIVLVLLVPMLISYGVGKGYVLGVVNDQIAGEVDVDSLSVGWLSGQSLTGVVVRDVDGVEIARVGRVELADASLLSLVRGGLSLGELQIESVTADVIGYEDGTTNLQRAFAGQGVAPPSSGKTPTKRTPGGTSSSGKTPTGHSGGGVAEVAWPAGLSFGLVVRDVDISYRSENVTEPIRLMVSDADLSATDPAHLVLKLNAGLSQASRQGSVTADAQFDGLFNARGVYQLDKATAKIDMAATDLPIDLLDTLADQDGKLTELLGTSLNGKVLAGVTASGGKALIEATSEHLDVDGQFAFDDSSVTGIGTSRIRLTLTPDAWAVLTADGDKATSTLAQPVDVTVALADIDLPMNDGGLDLANASLDLGLVIGDAKLQIDGIGEVTLASTTGGINSTQLGSLITASFNTTSSINRKPGGVSLGIELADLFDADHQINASGLSAKVNGALTNSPIAAIMDELLPGVTHGLATRTLGPIMDAKVNIHATPQVEGHGVAGKFDVDLLTEGGEAGLMSTLIGRFAYGEEAIRTDLADGSYVKLTLTPGLIGAYQDAFGEPGEQGGQPDASAVSLSDPATIRLELSQASAQLRADDAGGYTLDPASIKLVGSVKSPKLVLEQLGKTAATLNELLVDIHSGGLAGDTRMMLNADIQYPAAAGDPPKPGAIKSTTTVSGLAGIDGAIEMSGASYKTDTHISQAPIDLMDAMFDMKGELVAAVGPRARVEAVGAYTPYPPDALTSDSPDASNTTGKDHGTGGIDIALKSQTASADMKLLIEDGRWALKADAPLSFQVTPRLSQTILKKVNPFLGGAISAKLPIGVMVKQEGFSVPLRDAGIADVNAGIRLELGELDLRGEGELKKLLDQLGVGDRSLLNVKFSPVVINLAGGKLSYKDLTMSIDKVVLGFSGEVDLGSELLDLRMTIPGTSLANIKWLKGAIPPDQVIVVPLTGTFDQPVIDFKLLTGEIAKAALQGQLKGVAGDAIGDKIGGDASEVVGGLLSDLLAGKKLEDLIQDPADTPTDETVDDSAPLDAQEAARKKQERQAANQALTDEERSERRERRRIRRERLEREQAERDAQQ
jgi:hypothetical protein